MKQRLRNEADRIEKAWDALELRTIDKARLSRKDFILLARGVLKPKSRKFEKGMPMNLGFFKAAAIEIFLREAFHKNTESTLTFKAKKIDFKESRDLSPDQLRKTVRYELNKIIKIITDRNERDDQIFSTFRTGLVMPKEEFAEDFHTHKKGAVVCRFGNLPTVVVRKKRLKLSNQRIKLKGQRAKLRARKVKMEGRKIRNLMKDSEWHNEKSVQFLPLSAITLLGRRTLHGSHPAPKGGVHSVLMTVFL